MTDSDLAETCAIAIMAKAPRPGRVKTRLSPPLAPEQAMQMSAAFLRDVSENIARAAKSAAIHGWVAYAPAGEAALFGGMLAERTRLVLADGASVERPGVAGFGRCLFQAIDVLLGMGYGAACVLNSDSPTLPTDALVSMAESLAAHGDRAVLGPAADGGYYLLAMKRPHWRLFSDIAWSTGEVAAQTRRRAADSGVELVELPPWYDVDDRASLVRLLDDLRDDAIRQSAPATSACARQLDLAALLTVDA